MLGQYEAFYALAKYGLPLTIMYEKAVLFSYANLVRNLFRNNFE